MSRLQDEVNKFAVKFFNNYGYKPPHDVLFNGLFSTRTNLSFCLCFDKFIGVASMINLSGMTCARCMKPITDETYQWVDEARKEMNEIRNSNKSNITINTEEKS